MTNERKNEIWAMLTPQERIEICNDFDYVCNCADYNDGYNDALVSIFGYRNLTAQAEEKPKEPKFKVGDKVQSVGIDPYHGKWVGIVEKILSNGENGYVYIVRFGDRPSGVIESDLEPYTGKPSQEIPLDVAESVETSTKSLGGFHVSPSGEIILRRDIDYQQYRLDLAKEIAVAMINEDWASISVTATAIDAVDMANEIVKRLKETEI